jgi:hypothetical protein
VSTTSTYLDDLRVSHPDLYEIETRGAGRGRHQPKTHEREFLATLDQSRMTAGKVSANCNTQYHAVHSSGARKASDIMYVVVHCTQGMTAVSAASWFQNPKSGGSTQLSVDASACYRTLPDLVIPWGAPGVNTQGWHIELAGYAEWSRAEWLAHHGTIYRAAYKSYFHAHKYGIPLRWLTDTQLAGRQQKGFITHRQVTRVFAGGSHTDPGAAFPEDVYMKNVRAWAA